MSTAVTPEQDWEAFRAEFATLLRVPVEELQPAAVVGVDFDIDSLGLSELAAFVFERYGVDLLDLDAEPIGGLSLSQLHGRLFNG